MKQLYILIITIISFNLSAQCNPDKHNTTWYNGWISCKENLSPNPARGVGHWIMYDFGHEYGLGKSYWWNNNEADALDNGVKTILVDVSDDGVKWNFWGTFELEQGSGKPHYVGEEGPDFESVKCRYLLLTALDNYGGKCYGFSEMKINVDLLSASEDLNESCLDVKILPNPFKNNATVEVSSNCYDALLSLYDAYGRELGNGLKISKGSSESHQLSGRNLVPGIYMIVVGDGVNVVRKKVVKVE